VAKLSHFWARLGRAQSARVWPRGVEAGLRLIFGIGREGEEVGIWKGIERQWKPQGSRYRDGGMAVTW
jgi:hypothetical protein